MAEASRLERRRSVRVKACGQLLARACGERGDGECALLVLRDVAQLADLRELITGLGYDVLEASSVSGAVCEIERRQGRLALVLVARELGAADGRDVLRYLRTRYPLVRRVLLELEAEPPDATAAHADAVLSGGRQGFEFTRGLR